MSDHTKGKMEVLDDRRIMTKSKALELADVSALCEQMRRTNIPISDLIPRIQKMADELRRLDDVEQELEAERKETKRWIEKANNERDARLALEQAIKDAQPVAWHTEDHITDRSATTYSKDMVYRWASKGWPVTPLYDLKGIK